MPITRRPAPFLRPFVRMLWAWDGAAACQSPRGDRERILPGGAMHIVLRLSDRRVRIFDGPEGTSGRIIGHAVVGGARATPYLRDVSGTDRSVGALLEPGAGEPLFGVPADALAGGHTSLEDLWRGEAGEARERLSEAGSVDRQLDVLESMLAARLRQARALHPAVVYALRRFR
ncbi:MAG TPA: DUF6597 domain-containing transcriptional factor, partial [Candidatus Polarisedimenticolia bacterium]|nr:DUF6597 domain-containing transcriptional factor [Candidatus Polarisedimenticolia bacterium]